MPSAVFVNNNEHENYHDSFAKTIGVQKLKQYKNEIDQVKNEIDQVKHE
jgi:hypothetical protein